jgi:hypothetical protein
LTKKESHIRLKRNFPFLQVLKSRAEQTVPSERVQRSIPASPKTGEETQGVKRLLLAIAVIALGTFLSLSIHAKITSKRKENTDK